MKHSNNFDVIRLIAAALVVLSHSFVLSTGNADPMSELTGGLSFGKIGIGIFFVMSGYLITNSWHRDPVLFHYIVKRILRLMPALIVVTLLTALILGSLVTTLSFKDYFQSFEVYVYIIKNSLLLTFHQFLPGVFEKNPYPDAVNGSLWTLPIEFFAYIAVAGIGICFQKINSRMLQKYALVSLITILSIVVALGDLFGGFNEGILVQAIWLLLSFSIGSFFYFNKEKFFSNWNPLVALALTLAFLISFNTFMLPLAAIAFLSHLSFSFAFSKKLFFNKAINHIGDLSYGIYIIAFPIQQTVILLLPGINWIECIMVSLPIIIALAYASWHLIEKRALLLKPHIIGTKAQ